MEWIRLVTMNAAAIAVVVEILIHFEGVSTPYLRIVEVLQLLHVDRCPN